MRAQYKKLSLWLGLSFLLLLVAVEFVLILNLNNGFFVYSLDDAYIHLAMAENIRLGHYGVNLNEYSAAASSIIWPVLLALLPEWEFFPLLLNIFSALLTLLAVYRILDLVLKISNFWQRELLIASFLIIFVLVTNLVGLIFTGMEHSLQVLVVVWIALGLMINIERAKLVVWLVPLIILAPLARYENLAVSLAAILYLILNKYFMPAFLALLGSLGLVILFSLFIDSLGLGLVPTSILIKSVVVLNAGVAFSIFKNLMNNLENVGAQILLLAAVIFVVSSLFVVRWRSACLLASTACAILGHLVFGRHGLMIRYEIYIWSLTLVVACYFSASLFSRVVARYGIKGCLSIIVLTSLITMLTACEYVAELRSVPVASNNIYEQQYQMHRFVADYYKQPVAVNDIGYVAYKNDQYVLDLWGLASLETLRLRKAANGPSWMNDQVIQKQSKLIMIYDFWFDYNLPANWKRVATLSLSRDKISSAIGVVSFYVFDPSHETQIVKLLRDFSQTLPAGVVLKLT